MQNSITFQNSMLFFRFANGPHGPLPLINEEKKFIMFWTLRCGCTTSIYWFFGTLGLQKRIDELYPDLDLGTRVHRYRDDIWIKDYYGDLQQQEAFQRIMKPDYFKFAIIRNPYSRLVSSYIGMMSNPVLFEILRNNGLSCDVSEKISFSQFVDFLSNVDLYRFDTHLRYQTANVCWDLDYKLDYVIKLETIEQGIDYLNKRFSLRIPIKTLYASKKFIPPDGTSFGHVAFNQLMEVNRNLGIPHYKSLYTREIVQKVTKLYEADIDQLGYSF